MQSKSERVVLVVQARVGSSRLPRKMLRDLCGKPILQRVLERVRCSKLAQCFVLAVPDTEDNASLSAFASDYGFEFFQGSEDDVLDRFYQAVSCQLDVSQSGAAVIRVCADNPFIDPVEVDRLVRTFFRGTYDYAFNHRPVMGSNYVDGLGAEIFSFSVLERICRATTEPSEREHVTKYVFEHTAEFAIGVVEAPVGLAFPEIKLDIDTDRDLQRARSVYESLLNTGGERLFSGSEIVAHARMLEL